MLMNKKGALDTLRDIVIVVIIVLVVLFIILLASGTLQGILKKISEITRFGV